MEPKKNPRYDVHKKRNLIFNFSLALSLLIVISAFNIAVPYEKGKTVIPEPPEPDIFVSPVPATTYDKRVPLPVEIPKHKPIDLSRVRPADEINGPTSDQTTQPVEYPVDSFAGIVLPTEVIDDTTTFFLIVEQKPEPIGGFAGFYRTLSENIRYPKKAIRYGTTGTVYVEFIVERNGEPGRMRVVRGIGNGCDEEAIRIISLSRWNPGEQRGKPVRVKMVLPVAFRLQE